MTRSDSRTVHMPAGPRGLRNVAPPDPEELRQRLRDLDQRFRRDRKDEGLSRKAMLQTEMGYMRRMLDQGKRAVDVTYPVNPPYAFVRIRFNEDEGEFEYHVKEPTLQGDEPLTMAQVRTRMEQMTDSDELPVVGIENLAESLEVRDFLHEKFEDAIELYDFDVPEERRRAMFYHIQRDMVGLGRADPVLRDPFVEDVSCNGTRVPIYVFHRVFGSIKTNVAYQTELELNKYILQLAQSSGKHVSVYQPILDATLRDGSRINLTLGTEVTKKGSTFSIRKFSQDPISPIDLIRFGSVDAGLMAWFWQLIDNKRSLLVSGGTASGKTTLLNALGMFIRQEDKVVSIEDTPEVHLAHENWIQSVARQGYGTGGSGGKQSGAIDMFDLLVAALRQRPEYVLVGEVRGKEAFTLFQAISTGHAAMATVHAANMKELLHRIENEPMKIPRVMFQALDAVCFPGQVVRKGQRVRRVRGVTEILDIDSRTGDMLTNDVYRWDAAEDEQRFLGRSFALEHISQATGRSLDEVQRELRQKQHFLELMTGLGLSHVSEVTHAINDYALDPETAVHSLQQRAGG